MSATVVRHHAPENVGPWQLPDCTRLIHKEYGWEVVYQYDRCYEYWFLWNGRSLMVLEDWLPEEFEILGDRDVMREAV